VKVGHCNSIALKAVLSQLWGEAVSRYNDGEKWWFEDEAVINASQEIQDSKSESDDMEIQVDQFLEMATGPFGSLDIWKNVFHGKEDNFTKSTQMRVAKMLKKSGCIKNKMTKKWSKS